MKDNLTHMLRECNHEKLYVHRFINSVPSPRLISRKVNMSIFHAISPCFVVHLSEITPLFEGAT